MLPIYTFFNDILKKIINNETIPYEINISGGNECGKTRACEEFISKLFDIGNIGIVAIRENRQGADELFNELLGEVQNSNQNITYNKLEYKIKSTKNNTLLRLIYLNRRTQKSKSTLAGTSRFFNVKYLFVFVDETSELNEKDRNDINIRIRADNINTQICYINVCNPYDITNPHVRYLSDNLPFNKVSLMSYGYQFLKKDNKIFLHVN
jgi:hypothetical protein